MKNRKALVFAGAFALFLVGLLGGDQLVKWLRGDAAIEQAANAVINKARPAFKLPDLEGIAHDVSEWDGKILIVNFWATWCPPCRKEIPEFIAMQEEYGAQGLQFIGIAIDEAQKVQDFADEMGINYPLLIGADDAIEAAKAFGNRYGALPYSAIVDRQGRIVHVERGKLNRQEAEAVFKPIL